MNVLPKNEPILLASASPRRRELLALLGVRFDVVVPDVDETPLPDEPPRAFAERMARDKAAAVASSGVVVAADTVVVLGGRILGKPADAADARAMLAALSGRTHRVLTGVCVRRNERAHVFSVATEVEFRPLCEEEISAYVDSGEPMDKAGAYAVQGGASSMVRALRGSYSNVVGLPLCELRQALLDALSS